MLLENVEPIQRLFKQIGTHFIDELMASLTPAAFIESHYSEVQRAKKRIANRQANRQASAQLDSVKLKTKELKQEIDSLDASFSSNAQSQKALETKRDQLMLELDRVNKAIAEA